MQTIELFRSDTLRATARIHKDDRERPIFVVFDYFRGDVISDERDLDGDCFGENFFPKYGIDAVFIRPRDNDWYQNPDIIAAIAVVKSVVTHRRRVFTYGESMGGYAAIRYAATLNATAVALAPQYSVDRNMAPFEKRWPGTELLQFPVEKQSPIAQPPNAYVLFDPYHWEDGRHVALLNNDVIVSLLPLPYAGHLLSPLLAKTGLLKALIFALVSNKFDPTDYVRKALKVRRYSEEYLERLSRFHEARQPKLALTLARMSCAVSQSPPPRHHLSRMLQHNGFWNEAVEVARGVHKDKPDHIGYKKYLGLLLALKEQTAVEAIEVLEGVISSEPGVSDHYLWLGTAYMRAGKLARGLGAINISIDIANDPEERRRSEQIRQKIIRRMYIRPWLWPAVFRAMHRSAPARIRPIQQADRTRLS